MVEPQLAACLAIADAFLGLQNVKSVIELGARDCAETAVLSAAMPGAHIYSFECNPATLPTCRRVAGLLPNVTLIEQAVSDTDGDLPFYPIDQARTVTTWPDGNPGASSLLRASGKYPIEQYRQLEMTVRATTLRSFMEMSGLADLDILWMDIQGAELRALKGLGEKIRGIKLIHTEVAFFEIYEQQPLFRAVKRFLNRRGFRLLTFTQYGQFAGDAVFVNESLVESATRRVALRARDVFSPLRFRLRIFAATAAGAVSNGLARCVSR